jgi:hypothetical protein
MASCRTASCRTTSYRGTKNLQKFTKICKKLQKFTKIYKNLQKFTKIYKNLQIREVFWAETEFCKIDPCPGRIPARSL